MSNKNNLVHARTCVYNVGYHIIFTTKYRKQVFKDKIESRLKEILYQVAEDNGGTPQLVILIRLQKVLS